MKIEDLIEVNWYEAFVAEHTMSLRHEIVRTIRRYCSNTGKPYQDVWRSVYARLVRETGLDLSRPAKTKLDIVEAEGQLDTLYRIVVQSYA
jgi:hypothetical protein